MMWTNWVTVERLTANFFSTKLYLVLEVLFNNILLLEIRCVKWSRLFRKICVVCSCFITNACVLLPQNTTQKSISIVFSVSVIRHDSSLSKYRNQKQSPPWTFAIFSISRGGLLLFTVLAEWRIMTNSAKNNGDGLLCSILCYYSISYWIYIQ